MRLVIILFLPCLLGAQLILTGPVPKGPNPPVVFVNGYQSNCAGSDFASNFYSADKLMQANSIVSLYFDNCGIGMLGVSRPTIEAEGVAFGKFLGALRYADGTPVTQVDVVAHSMGGLIVRSYLSGKQDVTPAVFMPPAAPPIRRIVFLATPHFGTRVAGLLGTDGQTAEMTPGSQFLFDLNSWNQGTDDLRGLSAIAVAGTGDSTGTESGVAGFDDGVVALTSASIGFYRSGVTRIVPYCHTANALLQAFGACPASTPVLNNISTDPNNPVSQIVVSFLTGTNAWQSVGQAAEANSTLSVRAGLTIQLRDQNDAPLPVTSAVTGSAPSTIALQANMASSLVYSETLAASKLDFQISPLGGVLQPATLDLTLSATTELPAVVKAGPMISPKGVIPAAGPAPFPFDVAPGAFVSIYGSNFASSSPSIGQTQPYPTQVGDVQVLVNGNFAQIQYAGAGLINIVFPGVAPGLATLTVKNANGQNTVNVRVAPAVPAIFLLDGAATAAAVNALSGNVVGTNAPLHAGDYVSLYLTGLGATITQNSLNYAQIQPALTIGGQSVQVLYAGRSPGFAGLDQINAQIPAGVTGAAVPVVVNSGGRLSSTAYIAIQ